MIKGFAHVALYTSKLEETIKFYEEVFDAKNLGIFQASNKGCWLEIGKDKLEVFESEDLGTGCIKHFAISCNNVDELYQKALNHGASRLVEPKAIYLALEIPVKARIAFIAGINGEQIELFEEE